MFETDSPMSAQLHYLETVLGIRSVLLPEGSVAPVAVAAPAPQIQVRMRGSPNGARLIAIWGRSASASGEAEILAQKMVAAMKLAPTDVLWMEWDETSEEDPAELSNEITKIVHQPGPPVLVFGERTAEKLIPVRVQAGRWIDYKGGRFMVTLAPETLLASAEKKKVAWAHLQTAMKVI